MLLLYHTIALGTAGKSKALLFEQGLPTGAQPLSAARGNSHATSELLAKRQTVHLPCQRTDKRHVYGKSGRESCHVRKSPQRQQVLRDANRQERSEERHEGNHCVDLAKRNDMRGDSSRRKRYFPNKRHQCSLRNDIANRKRGDERDRPAKKHSGKPVEKGEIEPGVQCSVIQAHERYHAARHEQREGKLLVKRPFFRGGFCNSDITCRIFVNIRCGNRNSGAKAHTA